MQSLPWTVGLERNRRSEEVLIEDIIGVQHIQNNLRIDKGCVIPNIRSDVGFEGKTALRLQSRFMT